MQTLPVRLALVVLGAALVLAGCSDDDEGPSSTPSGDSQREITLPDSLGDLLSFDAACAERDENADLCQENAEDRQEVVLAAADNLSEAYDGAATAAREYTTPELDRFAQLLAVAAPSPGLWTSESDVSAEYTHVGHPREWVEERDGIQCLAATTVSVREGEELDPDDTIVIRCQATDDGLTVLLRPAGGEISLDEAFDWTSEAFEAAS